MPTGRAHLCPHHCPKPDSGGGLLVLIVVAIVVLGLLGLLGAAAHAVAPAISSMLRTAVEILKIAGAVVAGSAIVGALGWLVVTRQRAAQWETNAAARARYCPPAVAEITPAATAPEELPAAARAPLAIEAPRPWARETSGLGELAEPQPIQIRRQQS